MVNRVGHEAWRVQTTFLYMNTTMKVRVEQSDEGPILMALWSAAVTILSE